MNAEESTPLLQTGDREKKQTLFSVRNRILIAGCIISIALSFTQVPILYAFRLMECDDYYRHNVVDHLNDRCNRSEIDAGTATQVSILGLSTTLCGVLNLFYAGHQIKRFGVRTALVLQTAFPALRVAIQVVGISVGAKDGIIIVQCSQLVSLIGGMAGYLLVLNTAIGEVVAASDRTASFGMLQGSVMLGTSVGYLLGGLVSDLSGIRRPFEMATILFVLSSVYSAVCIPAIQLKEPPADASGATQSKLSTYLGGLKTLVPRTIQFSDGGKAKYYGITLLASGVFMGVLATGYAPYLIQLYATAAFQFLPTENGYLMASNSLIRGFFLIFVFPKIISAGRGWYVSRSKVSFTEEVAPAPATLPSEIGLPADGVLVQSAIEADDLGGRDFDLAFLRWSLVADGLVTASTAFATKGWHIYLAGLCLPLASGSAPASKGVITEMCKPSERADALQAMTIVENAAMLSTLGLFGFIFATFSDMGMAYLTFYCNAAVAVLAVAILMLSYFPTDRRKKADSVES